ncbi:hypothetical protein AMTR_s00020p00249760 [Amborella trichopoda]|uniref:Uncharacterized protein n=1 Tax=Amborella trichopoda TaxID=13333 RepID=W1PVT3_AMBTC|nr:hypothetical protein AMTR_s00020p00249760 [Amborella trichopoda]
MEEWTQQAEDRREWRKSKGGEKCVTGQRQRLVWEGWLQVVVEAEMRAARVGGGSGGREDSS